MPNDDGAGGKYDKFDDKEARDPLIPRNIKEKAESQTAVAVKNDPDQHNKPRITAAGREKIAEQILDLAFEHGVRVREDSALAEMLAALELDSPIPEDAFIAVAEILSQVYKANGQEDPFDAILKEHAAHNEENETESGEDHAPGKDAGRPPKPDTTPGTTNED